MRQLSVFCIALLLWCGCEHVPQNLRGADAFSGPTLPTSTTRTQQRHERQRRRRRTGFASAASSSKVDEVSLNEDTPSSVSTSSRKVKKGGSPRATSKNSRVKEEVKVKEKSWQDDLDELLDPTTGPSRRQVLLRELLSEGADIRASVEKALRDRNVRCFSRMGSLWCLNRQRILHFPLDESFHECSFCSHKIHL